MTAKQFNNISNTKNVLVGEFSEIKKMLLYLAQYGIYVDSICSEQREYTGIRILNKRIYNKSYYQDKLEEYLFIVCATDEPDIEKYRNLFDTDKINYVTGMDLDLDLYEEKFNPNSLYRMIYDARTRDLIIWGGRSDRQCREICRILELLDVKVDCILDDVPESYLNDRICTYPIWIKPLYDLLNREKGTYRVVVTEAREREVYRLEELGLEAARDYTDARGYHRYISVPKGLDPILGYNFSIDKKRNLPGFVCFGDCQAEKRIVILGGSTSDATFEPYRSWGEILQDQLNKQGLSVMVYCGACAGYNSSQELNKLIRDVLPLKPDVILSYSGYNDAFIKEPTKENYAKYPYYMYYQIDLMDSLAGYRNESNSNYAITDNYFLGLPHNLTRWQQYVNNIRTAYAVSKEFGIPYFCFLQPCLIEKKNKWSTDEKELYINSGKSDIYCKNIREFYLNADSFKASFFHNITDLFDSDGDVYMDECHVNEKGNQIIAKHIGNVILRFLSDDL